MYCSFSSSCILISIFALAVANAFNVIPPTIQHHTHKHHTYNTPWILFLSSNDDGNRSRPINASTSNNEFSRTIRVSKWFSGSGGGGQRGGNKVMEVQLFATPEERYALATRFRLSDISSLTADLVVQPALSSGNAGDVGECIEASGTVCAQVTQTCVRTNEDFDISMEFSFNTVLRAMSPTNVGSASNTKDESEPLSEGELAALEAASRIDSGKQSRKKKGGNKQKVKGVRGGQSSRDLDGSGMKQLQDILTEYEVTDEIIEDENCFCTDGIVDCGEIVAQVFRSKLDPYPKKPGSGPVSYTFTF